MIFIYRRFEKVICDALLAGSYVGIYLPMHIRVTYLSHTYLVNIFLYIYRVEATYTYVQVD